eukprot:Platyproteum_vivax@DN7449_c0_g1_i4.p1
MRVAMPRKDISSYFENMANVFSSREWAHIHAGSTDQEKMKRFYLLWAMKESFVKAIGTGLYTDPSRLECTANAIYQDGQLQPCQFLVMDPFPSEETEQETGAVVSVCVAAPSLATEQYQAFMPRDPGPLPQTCSLSINQFHF